MHVIIKIIGQYQDSKTWHPWPTKFHKGPYSVGRQWENLFPHTNNMGNTTVNRVTSERTKQ